MPVQLTIEPNSGTSKFGCPAADKDQLLGSARRPKWEERPQSPWPFLAGHLHTICDVIERNGTPLIPDACGPLVADALRQAAAGYRALLDTGELDKDLDRIELTDETSSKGPSARVPHGLLAEAVAEQQISGAVVYSGWQPRAYSRPGAGVEIRRVHLSKGASWTEDDARRSALTIALALTRRDAEIKNVRAVTVFCADREVVELFDLSSDDVADRWLRDTLPPLLPLATDDAVFTPGSVCGECAYLPKCTAGRTTRQLISSVRLVGTPIRVATEPETLFAFSPALLRDALSCPALAAAKAMKLAGTTGDDETDSQLHGKARGDAAHIWLARAHSRRKRCKLDDLADAALADDIAPELLDEIHPYLAQHIEHCPWPEEAYSVTEERYALHDSAGGFVLALKPDAVWAEAGRSVIYEVKTCKRPPVATAEQLLAHDMGAACYLTALASGAFGNGQAVRYEFLAPDSRDEPLVIELPVDDKDLVDKASKRVAAAIAAITGPVDRLEAHERVPDIRLCEHCTMQRWCAEGRDAVRLGRSKPFTAGPELAELDEPPF